MTTMNLQLRYSDNIGLRLKEKQLPDRTREVLEKLLSTGCEVFRSEYVTGQGNPLHFLLPNISTEQYFTVSDALRSGEFPYALVSEKVCAPILYTFEHTF